MLTWIKKNDNTDYFELIDSIDAKLIPLGHPMFRSDKPPTGRYFAIRHDVDHDIEHALAMAKAEADHNIYSTYFLLHTAGYFWRALNVADFIMLGHDVALHNDVLWSQKENAEFKPFDDPKVILHNALLNLRENGIKVIGTSSHGQPSYDFVNYNIWKESGHPNAQFSLADFGLEYEAYFLKHDTYISDSGGKWYGGPKAKFENVAQENHPEIVHNAIANFNKQENGLLQILIHPWWWEEREDV